MVNTRTGSPAPVEGGGSSRAQLVLVPGSQRSQQKLARWLEELELGGCTGTGEDERKHSESGRRTQVEKRNTWWIRPECLSWCWSSGELQVWEPGQLLQNLSVRLLTGCGSAVSDESQLSEEQRTYQDVRGQRRITLSCFRKVKFLFETFWVVNNSRGSALRATTHNLFWSGREVTNGGQSYLAKWRKKR